jgi:hypothetical protein
MGAPGAGLVPFRRFYNATTGDYLLDTATTPAPGSGYVAQGPIRYVRATGIPATGGGATGYTRNALGQVTQVTTPNNTGRCQVNQVVVASTPSCHASRVSMRRRRSTM